MAGGLRNGRRKLLDLEPQLVDVVLRYAVDPPTCLLCFLDQAAQALFGVADLRQVVRLCRFTTCVLQRLGEALLQRPDGVAGARFADLDMLDDVAQRPFERAVARNVVGTLRCRMPGSEALRDLVEPLLHGTEGGRGVLLVGIEALQNALQYRVLVGAHVPRHRGIAFVPGNRMELLGDLFQPQRHFLALAVLGSGQRLRPVGRTPVAPLEVVAAFGRIENHRIEPFADGHARLARRLLGCLAGLLLNTLDAPRDTRLHVMPLSLVDASPATLQMAYARTCCT
jgi:hypothetical protein